MLIEKVDELSMETDIFKMPSWYNYTIKIL